MQQSLNITSNTLVKISMKRTNFMPFVANISNPIWLFKKAKIKKKLYLDEYIMRRGGGEEKTDKYFIVIIYH